MEIVTLQKVDSAVVQAYARTNLFSQRAEMMEHYAQFIQECLNEARKQINEQKQQDPTDNIS